MANPLRECQQGACEFRSLLPSLAPRPLGHPENLLPLLSKSSAFFSFGFPRFCSYFLRPQSGGGSILTSRGGPVALTAPPQPARPSARPARPLGPSAPGLPFHSPQLTPPPPPRAAHPASRCCPRFGHSTSGRAQGPVPAVASAGSAAPRRWLPRPPPPQRGLLWPPHLTGLPAVPRTSAAGFPRAGPCRPPLPPSAHCRAPSCWSSVEG